ncbi:MAG TPA: hypothetical protein VKU41_15635 [Polyangiaceae bacterium]|nr:hypothetical protein [Polyangiaceae bacterium]
MSLSREMIIELMQLADGELEGDALERAEKLVASSDEARHAVERMRATDWGPWLEAEMLGRADAAGAGSIADAVMAKVEAATRLQQDRVVVSMPVGGVGRDRTSRRGPLVAAGFVLVSLAAGLALYIHATRSPSESEETPLASAGPSPRVDVAPSAVAQGAGASGVEVDEIDSPSHGVSVFEIPMGAAAVAGAGHAPSVVIWIEDEPGGSK